MKTRKLSSGRKGKIADEKFRRWLEFRRYKILGREFKTSSHTGGWPDFLAQKSGRFYFFEVKSGKHRVDPHQMQVLRILKKLGKVRIMRLDQHMKKFQDETPLEFR